MTRENRTVIRYRQVLVDGTEMIEIVGIDNVTRRSELPVGYLGGYPHFYRQGRYGILLETHNTELPDLLSVFERRSGNAHVSNVWNQYCVVPRFPRLSVTTPAGLGRLVDVMKDAGKRLHVAKKLEWADSDSVTREVTI